MYFLRDFGRPKQFFKQASLFFFFSPPEVARFGSRSLGAFSPSLTVLKGSYPLRGVNAATALWYLYHCSEQGDSVQGGI